MNKNLFFLFLSMMTMLSTMRGAGEDWLLRSVSMQSLYEVEGALNRGANIYAKNQGGYTVLEIACTYDDVKMMRFLIDRGADIDSKGKIKNLLHYAAKHGLLKVAKFLIEEKNFDINVQSNRWHKTALHKAIDNGRVEIVQFLLSKGADVTIEDFFDCTPLESAYLCQEENREDPFSVDWELDQRYDQIITLLCMSEVVPLNEESLF